jgi:hypothetical protein
MNDLHELQEDLYTFGHARLLLEHLVNTIEGPFCPSSDVCNWKKVLISEVD